MREEIKNRISKKCGEYTVVPNEIVFNRSLSAKAKGILLYLLSRPDDWQFYFDEIEEHFTDGRRAIRSGVAELESVGYVTITMQNGDDGHIFYEWAINPNVQNVKLADFTKCTSTKRDSYINNISNIKDINNNTISSTEKYTVYSFEEFWNDYGVKKSKKACERKYKKLSEKKRSAIKNALPAYLASTPIVQYRKHPTTYLNNESWEDEILQGDKKILIDKPIEKPMGLR